jgi:hypothetical protein
MKIVTYLETYLLNIVEVSQTVPVLYGSSYSFLTNNDIAFSKFNETVSAQVAPKDIGKMMGTPTGHCFLKRIRYGYD